MNLAHKCTALKEDVSKARKVTDLEKVNNLLMEYLEEER